MSAIRQDFDFEKKYVLESDTILIRPMERADFDNLLPFSLNEPDIWKYSLVSAAGEENLARYIESALSERRNGRQYTFVIFDKVTSRFVGSTRFCEIDLVSKTLQMGYTWYGKAFQGTSINKQCKLLLLTFVFNKINMERVEFRVDVNNARGIAVLEKMGCTLEGRLRKCAFSADGSRRDCFVYSMLADEWNLELRERLRHYVDIKKLSVPMA